MYLLVILLSLSLFLLIHSYFFYPVTISILAKLLKKKYRTDELHQPNISILISAYNEEKVIVQTVKKLFDSDYPTNKMEILVGSDCSTDNTDSLLNELMKEIPVLKLFKFKTRRGKKSVINDLVNESKGEVLVFCDSNSRYEVNALKNLVKYYTDNNVGGVCGRLKLIADDFNIQSGNKEKKYWDYETQIKILEGKLGTLIGSNGAIYSLRKELFIPMPEKEHVVDDLYLSLKVLEQDKDFIYSLEAEAVEKLETSLKQEFNRKVRILPRNLETLKKTKSLLFSKRILVSYCYWSHKVIRWLSPLLLIALLISNLILIGSASIFDYFIYLQIFFYLSAFVGFLLSNINIKIPFFELSFYFMLTNLAILVGYKQFILKKHKPIWEPTVRE